jgi:copper homeostasis protein
VTVVVEGCVTSLAEARECADSGADRLELCYDLDVDGVTPGTALVEAVVQAIQIPAFVMVRSRPGPFVYAPDEVAAMEETVREMKAAGAAGIVVGALTDRGTVDQEALRRWVAAAGSLPVTFHRAFDEISDGSAALDQATALAGLVDAAQDRIGIIAAGGVRADHVSVLVARTGVAEVHARAEGVRALVRGLEGPVTTNAAR